MGTVPGFPLAFDGGGPAQFMHVNALNSTTMETSYSGGVSSDVLVYPWGDMGKNPVQSAYQFAGTIWMDGYSSADFATYRLYRYDQGRWLTPDPLGGGEEGGQVPFSLVERGGRIPA